MPTNACGRMNVTLLYNNQRHVSANHVYKSLTQSTIPHKIHLIVYIILISTYFSS